MIRPKFPYEFSPVTQAHTEIFHQKLRAFYTEQFPMKGIIPHPKCTLPHTYVVQDNKIVIAGTIFFITLTPSCFCNTFLWKPSIGPRVGEVFAQKSF